MHKNCYLFLHAFPSLDSSDQVNECQILLLCIYLRKQYNELQKYLLVSNPLKYFQTNLFGF